MTAEKLKNLLKPSKNGELAAIIRRAQDMGELTGVLSQALPESERAAIVAANVRDNGELVVLCASSAWASRLRYETDILLQAARESGVDASVCRIRVSQG